MTRRQLLVWGGVIMVTSGLIGRLAQRQCGYWKLAQESIKRGWNKPVVLVPQ